MVFERIKGRTLPEFVARAMKLIGAGLGDVVDDRAGIASKFGVVVGHDLHFGECVLVAEERSMDR